MKKNKKRNLVDLIATIAVLSGLCGLIYTGVTDFESEESQTRSISASCMATLVGGMLFAIGSDKQR